MSVSSGASSFSGHPSHPPNSLRNPVSFPTIDHLHEEFKPGGPHYRCLHITYITPARHWCFIAQIVGVCSLPILLILRVQDKDGHECIVTFNNSDRGAGFRRDAIIGRTIAIIGPDSHRFIDGGTGIRLEDEHIDEGRVKIFPFRLEKMLEANDIIQARGAQKKCEHCGKREGSLRSCARCGTFYCSKGSTRAHTKR